jgi:hypothetical protein
MQCFDVVLFIHVYAAPNKVGALTWINIFYVYKYNCLINYVYPHAILAHETSWLINKDTNKGQNATFSISEKHLHHFNIVLIKFPVFFILFNH